MRRRKPPATPEIKEESKLELAPAIVPQMAGLAVGQHAPVSEQAREKPKMFSECIEMKLSG